MPRALIALTVLAAALRLPTLGSQSLWLDEALTGRLARGSLGDLLHRVATEEANPPLFYLLEWVWTRVAGTSEVALRLPSALFGIALVPVAYAIGRRLGGQRAAVALAALVAVHPLLVYYSQEARGYAAVALACAVGFGCFLDALEGEAGDVVGARVRGRARLPLLRDLPGRDRGGDPARAPRSRGAARRSAGSRWPERALLPLLAEQLGGDHTDNVIGGHRAGRAGEGRRDELAGGRAGGGDRRTRVAGGRAAGSPVVGGRLRRRVIARLEPRDAVGGTVRLRGAGGRRSCPRRSAGARPR